MDAAPRAPASPPRDGDARAQAVRDVVSRRATSAPRQRLNGSLCSLPAACRCAPAADAPGAWEGSALVDHGALLQFGCLMFVFSVADARPFPYECPNENPAL
ncbi:hypothetical protein MSG28_005987 [Choristoneura fumiferana]|uniref:Uncharacterized protein n=3 Tax=Choristoneura fumiferana TaxID=7141 RepID=A0ACC0L197_CHOFU|nr:hypothetical protein MSG28_005987 [Choristoneura fumiferana]